MLLTPVLRRGPHAYAPYYTFLSSCYTGTGAEGHWNYKYQLLIIVSLYFSWMIFDNQSKDLWGVRCFWNVELVNIENNTDIVDTTQI